MHLFSTLKIISKSYCLGETRRADKEKVTSDSSTAFENNAVLRSMTRVIQMREQGKHMSSAKGAHTNDPVTKQPEKDE